MFTTALVILALAHGAQATAAAIPSQSSRAASESQLEFHSDFLMNLHHTLYGAAWARRPDAGTVRALAGRLPAPLEAPLTAEEQRAWTAALDYYDREVASRDLLFGAGMRSLKLALVAGDLSHASVGTPLRTALESAAPVYRKHFWPAHDRANRAWIDLAARDLRTIAPEVVRGLTRVYDAPWFTSPVRVDVVWVANRQGAYTTNTPAHATIASGERNLTGWSAVEIVFHELSHALVLGIERRLAAALGDQLQKHAVLWHVVQFYLTGQVVRDVLAGRGIGYTPYLYSTGLFERAWPHYRTVVEEHWRPYLEGRSTLERAVEGTVTALGR